MLSLKQIGTICLSILIPTFSAFATPDIASNANGNGSCVEPVLHRYDGTANLQAGWQANTIQLKWYNGDEQLNVQSAANSCTYDGALTLPSIQPTKTGYTFAGWRVKTISATPSEPEAEPEPSGGSCSLTSSDVTNAEIEYDATHMRWKPLNGSDGYTMEEEFEEENSTGLNNGEWEVIDSNGNKYRGIASCNSTQPSYDWESLNNADDAIWENESLTEEEKEAQSDALYAAAYANSANQSPAGTMNSNSMGQYCWCKATSYIPTGGSSCNVSSLAWVFNYGSGSASNCASHCAFACADNAQDNSAFRSAVFGVAGN